MSSQNHTNNSIEDSFDEEKLDILKKSVSLTKSQLLELAYDDNKFLSKLQELNQKGYNCILEQKFHQAIIYLSEAENILEYAASCGKTIQRNLIISTLQNQACVYHRVWQLQKSISYIEAIIYNITSYLDSQKGIQFKQNIFQQNSEEFLKGSLYLKNKLQLIFFYLQFCAVSSQNQNHQNALSAASKALTILKQLCQQQYNLERIARKSGISNEQQHYQLLLQLHNIKQSSDQTNQQPLQKIIEKFLIKAKKTILRFQNKLPENKIKYSQIQKQLQNYSIGFVMQINPTLISTNPLVLDLKQQLMYIKKIYKAIYISISHFTLATELRLLSSEKYPTDAHQKKESFEFKTSEIHHLISIITAGLYVPCETIYFEHIINSFKNHYQIDILSDSQISVNSQTLNEEDHDLIHLQTSSLNQKKSNTYTQEHIYSEPNLRNSIKNQENKIEKSHIENKNSKKNISKKKLSSIPPSQKSIKSSETRDTQIKIPLLMKLDKNDSKDKKHSKQQKTSKSKGKSNKKIKDLGKSQKRSSRKLQQKVKSPPLHKRLTIQIKQQKKSKSKKKISNSKYDLNDSKEPITNIQNYNNPQEHQYSTTIQSKKTSIKNQKQFPLSRNVYIMKSNHQLKGLNKQKKNLTNSTTTITTESITFKSPLAKTLATKSKKKL